MNTELAPDRDATADATGWSNTFDASLPPLPDGWGGPFAMLLEDDIGDIVAANAALARLCGLSDAEGMVGLQTLDLQADESRDLFIEQRATWRDAVLAGCEMPPFETCLGLAGSDMRWVRVWWRADAPRHGRATLCWWLQDITAERRAAARVERSQQELTLWFTLSRAGKVVYDASGLVMRSNPVFDAMIGMELVSVAEAEADLQALLGWQDGGLRPDLRPGRPAIETLGELRPAPGRVLSVRARLRAFEADDGLQRVMAVIEDRSAEAERDLAQFEMGALMSAAGLGVATFDDDGVRRGGMGSGPMQTVPLLPAGLQNITRQMVDPGSHAAYERLQHALHRGLDAEVRYAVQHPKMGLRWLMTRVEPTRLRSGRRAMSVVTLDITDQELARQHGDQLSRELTTTLDASPVGIVYLRDGRVRRCNRRFERMLDLAPGEVAGAPVADVFVRRGAGQPGAITAAMAVESNRPCDVVLDIGSVDGEHTWYALSVRPAETHLPGSEAVAVLSDISSLKRQQAAIERTLHERELMFNQADVGMAWVRGGRIVRANPALAALSGWSEGELAGLALAALCEELHVEPADALPPGERRADGTTHPGEMQLTQRDGSRRWVQLTMRALDPQQPESDLVCSFVDVDERRRARESLQAQAGRTRAVLDSVLVGIVTLGEQGIEWMNRSARRMFGGELADFEGRSLALVAMPEPDHPLRRTDWLHSLADGQAESFECRLRARDGREFWVVGNAVATPRDGDGARQVTFALLDIESRRQAEVRVSGARASLQRLIETAPLAIAVFETRQWSVVECNQASEAFFGRTRGELMGCGAEVTFDDASQGEALKVSLLLAAEAGEGVRREITRPGDERLRERRWDTRFVPLQDAGGPRPAQVLLVANDVSELRQAEQARLDAEIAQREMLVKEVHHRIKNNLQGVAGLLQQTAQRRPQVRTELGEAIGQVQAIAQVYGLQVGADGPLDLLGVLRAIAGSVQRSQQRAIDVVAPAADGQRRWLLPERESIPLALTLNELLSNAVRHGDGGPVQCHFLARAGDVLIEIVNSGSLPAGFDLQHQPPGMVGLGLVRSLLPRRAATLTLQMRGEQVVTALTLRPPSVRPAAATEFLPA